MILVTGPLFSGKTDFARSLLPAGTDFSAAVCIDVQNLAVGCTDLTALADDLAGRYAVVTITEVGGGVVPTDPAQRAAREAAGRLGCLLAARAHTVVRVFCGLPLVLKGELPQ